MQKIKGHYILLCVICTLFAGCSTSSSEKEPKAEKEYAPGTYCYKGGQLNNFDCTKATASAAVPMHTRTVDEEWMYQKLEEIRDWLDEQKDMEQQP